MFLILFKIKTNSSAQQQPKVILPSTAYEESAVDTFALHVLLIITNFCSRKSCIKKPRRVKIPVQRNLHMTCIMWIL